MDTNNEYRTMCINSPEIQSKWNPAEGDFMLTKSSYCNDFDECTDNIPCPECLEMGNVYVISGKYDFHESIGGTHWFFGGSSCVKGEGNICNDTYCFIMTESGYAKNHSKLYTSSKDDKVWLPRQDQIQSMFLSGLTESYKVRRFLEWLNEEAEYNPHTYSLEMLWLMFYMFEIQDKAWNATSNIKKWQLA